MGLWLAACSPKVRPVAAPPKPVDTSAVVKPLVVAPSKPLPPPSTVISLLLPFGLNQIDLSKGAPKATLSKADLAMDYYQGFKMALDSLTYDGHNFKLQVFDTQDAITMAHNLALTTKVRTSALIVGPVYPEQIKSFSEAAPNLKKLLVSPLSPTPPANYKNPNLVTVVPPLQYHTWHVAEYIQSKLKAKKVFVLKSGYSDDNKYNVPFRKAIDSLGKKKIKIIELTVVRGDLSSLIPQLSLTEQNIFIIPATDEQFLQVTLKSLDDLEKKHYPVTLFGHPSWEDFTFLKPELLQRLNAYITSGDRVNFKAPRVIKFMRDYRRLYHTEPGEYAIKGYDEGLYFGHLADTTKTGVPNLVDYDGLHNSFRFVKTPNTGFVNSSVKLYKYINFDLKPVE